MVTASGRTNQGAEHQGWRTTKGRRCEEKTASDLVNAQAASHHLRYLALDFLKANQRLRGTHLASLQIPDSTLYLSSSIKEPFLFVL